MKKLLLFAVVIAAMLAAACSKYKYETVKGDPLNTKIYTLDNGLKVYMSVNKETPRIQTYIAVNVGGKNDPAETTGLAHYFEHLMFKGTQQFGTSDFAAEKPMLDQIENLFEVYRKTTDEAERAAIYHRIDSVSYEASKIAIPNEYDKLMSAIGANGTNAFTSQDMTVYVEDIPSNEIDNWAKIQADRFKNPVIRGFHTELETIYEEKNMSLTRDSRKVWEAMDANDYELFFGLYSDIVKQREKAKIQVKEDMPVLTVIEPVVEPTVPSKPQRALIVLASLLLGLFVGCGFVLIQPIFSQIVSSKKQAHTIPIKRMKKIS